MGGSLALGAKREVADQPALGVDEGCRACPEVSFRIWVPD